MSIVRIDPITGDSIVFAVDRSQRPSDLKKKEITNSQAGSPVQGKSPTCPFCPGQEEQTPPEILSRGQNGSWQTRAFENKFPIFRMNATGTTVTDKTDSSTELFREASESGMHLVIVEHPDHDHTFFQMSKDEMVQLLLTYQDAYRKVEEKGQLAYVLTFKNYQRKAGASLHHPHSQILGTSFIPTQVEKELLGFQRYQKETGRCIFCEMIDHEINGQREIRLTDNFLVLAPYGSRFSYETWILPRKHGAQFTELSVEEVKDLAWVLIDHFQALYQWLGDFPFNMYFHVGPLAGNEKGAVLEDFHWHIEIAPRMSSMAGFELGGGMQVNTVLPENVAQILSNRGDAK